MSCVAECLIAKQRIPFNDIVGLPKASAPTHLGNFIFGKMGRHDVLIIQGRLHVYEGFPIKLTTYPVRIASGLGIEKLILTNLSGGINPDFRVGDLMVVTDHINLSGLTPLIWDKGRPHTFTDMQDAYSPRLISLIGKSAKKLGIRLRKGVLAYFPGPSFETKAELNMLRILGADAVGWSLVPEVLEARRYEIEACGIACISDTADRPVDLGAIYRAGFNNSQNLKRLIFEFITGL
jgi:purine-nucleoside phosphorylase